MKTIKDAKKAAALEACKRLHQIGELDDHLLPKKQILCDEDVQFLFKHYPDVKEEKAGFVSNRRLCPVQVFFEFIFSIYNIKLNILCNF